MKEQQKTLKIIGKGGRLFELIAKLSKLHDFHPNQEFSYEYLVFILGEEKASEAVELLEDMRMVESYWK